MAAANSFLQLTKAFENTPHKPFHAEIVVVAPDFGILLRLTGLEGQWNLLNSCRICGKLTAQNSLRHRCSRGKFGFEPRDLIGLIGGHEAKLALELLQDPLD